MAARRVPEQVRAELPQRAQAGTGLDDTYLTTLRTGEIVPAKDAAHHDVSEQCVVLLNEVKDWLLSQGVDHFHIVSDLRGYGCRGLAAVVWDHGPSAHDVATVFATSTTADGLPQLPAWIALKAEHDFDLRWQPPY